MELVGSEGLRFGKPARYGPSSFPPPAPRLTHLLAAWTRGEKDALEQLTPLVYAELRRLAQWHLTRERRGHTLQATALVNEAYLRLVDVDRVQWQDRAHFFAMAARQMRRILIDAARARGNQKRGGDVLKVSLTQGLGVPDRPEDLIALDEALEALGEIDERRARVVEMRFFGGLSVEEVAEVLEGFSRHGQAGLEAGEGVVGTGASKAVTRLSVTSAGEKFRMAFIGRPRPRARPRDRCDSGCTLPASGGWLAGSLAILFVLTRSREHGSAMGGNGTFPLDGAGN